MARALKFLELYRNRQTKLWKVLFKYDKLPDHFHDLQSTLQTEFNLLKKAISKNIENLHKAINLQQTYTTPLCSHVNTIYTKLAQLNKQIKPIVFIPTPKQTWYRLMHQRMIPTLTVKQIHCQTYSHKYCHMPRTLKKIHPLSLPIPKSTPHFHRIPIDLNLSLNQFKILPNTLFIRTLNNSRNNAKTAKDPN